MSLKSSHVTIILCLLIIIVILIYVDLNLYWKDRISVKIPQNSTNSTNNKNQMSWLSAQKMCQILPKGLKGPIDINLNQEILQWAKIESENSDNFKGGLYYPNNCTARHKVAILIPYRDRDSHLRVLLHHLHPILKRQEITYTIYVIEQAGNTPFNRAMLFNIGFDMATYLTTQDFWNCFIFHDVDLLPEDDRNLYTCPTKPRQMAVAIDKFKYKMPYKGYFGGVSAMSTNDFKKVNGFSNKFWGWGGEDDDMHERIRSAGLEFTLHEPGIQRYKMIKHSQSWVNPKRSQILIENKKIYEEGLFKSDGLSNLKYRVEKVQEWYSHTKITVSVQN